MAMIAMMISGHDGGHDGGDNDKVADGEDDEELCSISHARSV